MYGVWFSFSSIIVRTLCNNPYFAENASKLHKERAFEQKIA
ncbi:hypothetical protein GLIP_2728 [Aliiglaciecola lipolytica E3]|uniref:Uncharacterized protein n=1 Tax=Aliiglaciecola lipolytica E3 TaxID=1127673 RepID=K6X409_9ALTE|nr:hypothetical protein GLIP_2728 [Aliiglaciecola lipolytica E3]